MTTKDDSRLNGRHHEFARMSNRPGIAADAVEFIIEFLSTEHGKSFLDSKGDVPDVLSHGGKKYPLGRYLKQRVRSALDLGGTPDKIINDLKKDHEEFVNNYMIENPDFYGSSKDMVIDYHEQGYQNMYRKQQIYSKGKTL